jgi:hypothetical protein
MKVGLQFYLDKKKNAEFLSYGIVNIIVLIKY